MLSWKQLFYLSIISGCFSLQYIFISLLRKNRMDQIFFFFKKTSVRMDEFLEFFEQLDFAIVNSFSGK